MEISEEIVIVKGNAIEIEIMNVNATEIVIGKENAVTPAVGPVHQRIVGLRVMVMGAIG